MSKIVITPEATLSFPHLLVPHAVKEGDPLKYSASFLFAQDVSIASLEAALMEALLEKWPAPKGQQMLQIGKLKWGIRNDWQAKQYPEGTRFVNARSDNQPGLVMPWADPTTKKAAIPTPDQIKKFFYAGAKVRAQLSAFIYDRPESKGVTFGLNNVQWLGHGKRLDGRQEAVDAFEVVQAEPVDLADVE